MNETATFFRNRNEDSGETYQFLVKTENGSHRFSVYARRPMQSKLFQDQEIRQKEFGTFLKNAGEAVEARGEGGLIVMVSGEAQTRSVEVRQAGSTVAEPASQFLILIPGIPAHFLPIKLKHKVRPGAHAIVPVDAEAEQRLAAFVEQLPWFSPDFEALVLNALRRPSLDARLSAVERRLFGQSVESKEENAVVRAWKWVVARARLSKPALYAFAAFIVLALVADATYLFYRWNPKIQKVQDQTATVPAGGGTAMTGTPATDTGTPTAPDTSKETLVTKMKELLAELRRTSARDSNIRLLYDNHFSQFDDTSLNDQTIADWFKKQTPTANSSGSRALLWGLIKLQALVLKVAPTGTAFLENNNNAAVVKAAFSGIAGPGADTTAMRLRAALSCRINYPDLAFTIKDTSCDKLTDDDIKNGLIPLTTYLRSIK